MPTSSSGSTRSQASSSCSPGRRPLSKTSSTRARCAFRTLEGFQEVAFGNTLALDPATIETNLRRVQDRPVLQEDGRSSRRSRRPTGRRSSWLVPAWTSASRWRLGPGRPTSTCERFGSAPEVGFTKFVIVVPSVAIREGVLSSLRILKEHIRDVYDGLQYDAYVYESRHLTRVRQFATASHLQILVMSIDSFTSDANVINRPTDAMNGYRPIEFLRACRPIVVMDEPQNMETPIRQEAVRVAAPAGPVAVLGDAPRPQASRLPSNPGGRIRPAPGEADRRPLDHKGRGPQRGVRRGDEDRRHARRRDSNRRIYKATKRGTKPTQVTLYKDDDLYELSGERDVYSGWTVEDIHAPSDAGPGVGRVRQRVHTHEGTAPRRCSEAATSSSA